MGSPLEMEVLTGKWQIIKLNGEVSIAIGKWLPEGTS